MITTIIFDLDGTLIHLPIDFPKLKKDIQKLLQTSHEPTPFLQSIIEHTKDNLPLRQKAWNLIDKYEEESIPQLELFSETIPVLQKLKEKKFTLALVTLQGRNAANLILRNLSMNMVFSTIVTRENSHLRHRQIELVLNILNTSKKDVIMVGDRLNDVKSSKNVGIACILIRRRYAPLEGITVIQSLDEILQYV